MLIMGILIVIAAAAAGYWVLELRAREPKSARPVNSYRGVVITCDEATACPAVRTIAGKRFLSTEAPNFPLVACTADTCDCRFKHYPDRRGGFRRAEETGIFQQGFDGFEQRQSTGERRATDVGGTSQLEGKVGEPTFDPEDSYYDFVAQTARDRS